MSTRVSARPRRIAPVKGCLHVRHVFHASTPWCTSCDSAYITMHRTCDRPESPRHAQPRWIGTGSEPKHIAQHGSSMICPTLSSGVKLGWLIPPTQFLYQKVFLGIYISRFKSFWTFIIATVVDAINSMTLRFIDCM